MADRSAARAIPVFVIGFILGMMFGGGGVALVLTVLGPETPEAVAASELPAPAMLEPEPEPEPEVEPEPGPEVEPEPRPTPVPTRKAAPAPAAAPEPPKLVSAPVTGPTDLVFIGSDGARHTPDAVPPGTFEVHANWGNGLVKSGQVTVKEGKPLKLLCDPPTQTCKAK